MAITTVAEFMSNGNHWDAVVMWEKCCGIAPRQNVLVANRGTGTWKKMDAGNVGG